MKKCIECGLPVRTKYEDYRCFRIKIPFLNIKLWGIEYQHHKCLLSKNKEVKNGI